MRSEEILVGSIIKAEIKAEQALSAYKSEVTSQNLMSWIQEELQSLRGRGFRLHGSEMAALIELGDILAENRRKHEQAQIRRI